MYDFMVFGYFATEIAAAFFPNQSPYASLMLALATFGAGFGRSSNGRLLLHSVDLRRRDSFSSELFLTVRNTDFRVFLASSFLFFLGGCVERGATPDAEPRNFNPPAAVRSGSAGDDSSSGPERIDVLGLQRSLGLDGMELGYFEKGFDSCAAGYGYRAGGDCKNLKFVVVRFQLQCRNSEGTEQNSDYQTTPVGAADIKWTLGGQKGVARTDGSGKSEIVAIAPKSPREAKLRLTRSNDFLLITAEDARRIVAPKSWCDQP